jgi:cytochrome c2
MKKIFVVLMLVWGSAQAAPFAKGDEQAGQKFFEQNRCNRCHIGKVGGDGSAIFTRPNRIVNNPQELIARMLYCSGNLGIKLTEQDEQNLGAYLNQRYYKFK